jgi:hypothetical protein
MFDINLFQQKSMCMKLWFLIMPIMLVVNGVYILLVIHNYKDWIFNLVLNIGLKSGRKTRWT